MFKELKVILCGKEIYSQKDFEKDSIPVDRFRLDFSSPTPSKSTISVCGYRINNLRNRNFLHSALVKPVHHGDYTDLEITPRDGRFFSFESTFNLTQECLLRVVGTID